MANALAATAKAPQKEAIEVFRPSVLFLLPFKSFFSVNHMHSVPKEDILIFF